MTLCDWTILTTVYAKQTGYRMPPVQCNKKKPKNNYTHYKTPRLKLNKCRKMVSVYKSGKNKTIKKIRN